MLTPHRAPWLCPSQNLCAWWTTPKMAASPFCISAIKLANGPSVIRCAKTSASAAMARAMAHLTANITQGLPISHRSQECVELGNWSIPPWADSIRPSRPHQISPKLSIGGLDPPIQYRWQTFWMGGSSPPMEEVEFLFHTNLRAIFSLNSFA